MRLDDRFSCVAENPLRIADEQFRGIWTDAGEQSGTWLVDVPEVGDCVISFIWSPTVSHPKVEPWIIALGCGALIYVQTLADQRECYIPIWGVHSFSPDAPDVARLSASATRALSLLRSNLLLTDGRRLALAGIVLMSDVNQASRNQPLFRAHFDDVHGYQFGANYRDRTSMLRIIPGMLLALIKVTLGDGSAKQ